MSIHKHPIYSLIYPKEIIKLRYRKENQHIKINSPDMLCIMHNSLYMDDDQEQRVLLSLGKSALKRE